MTSSCNSKMAAKKHLECSYLGNQCHFNAFCTISITTYHLDHVIRIRIDDVIMQYQDGRQGTFTMLISQEPTFRLTSFQRLPYCTIPSTTYHWDHVIRIRIDDVIMQYQDGCQGTFTMLISQEPTFQSTSFQSLLYYIDYNL